MARILIVDDDMVCGMLLSRFFGRAGHEAKAVATGREAIEVGARFMPDVLVTDWMLKDIYDGIDVAQTLHELHPAMKIVFMTGFASDQLANNLGHLPVLKILEKPLLVDALFEAISEVLEQRARPKVHL